MDGLYFETPADQRTQFLADNPDYHKARRLRDAFDYGLPELVHDEYVRWYTDTSLVKPDDWQQRTGTNEWYEDNWFLMENPVFYQAMVEAKLWATRDFSKVPSREVFDKYLDYLKIETATERDTFRWNNRDLDDWLLLTGKVSISIVEKRRRAALTPRERALEEFREKEEKLTRP